MEPSQRTNPTLTQNIKSLTTSFIRKHQALPDEAQCEVCGYFDISHPTVKLILGERLKIESHIMITAACKCDEMAAKQKMVESMRHKQANLPVRESTKTFSNFFKKEVEEALEASRAFVDGNGPTTLMFVGKTGCGKSHLLEAIGRQMLYEGKRVRYEQVADFLDTLRYSYQDSSDQDIHELMLWYQRQHVLLLDDLGASKRTEWAEERLTAIIDERMRTARPLVVATNCPNQDAMAEKLGDRIASRLFQTNEALSEVNVVIMTAADYRTKEG